MRLPKFEYIEPKSLREAIKILVAHPSETSLLAGGTDLLVNMKYGVVKPTRLVNLKSIPKLNYIIWEKETLRIGSLTSLHDIYTSPLIQEKFPILSQAAREVGAYAHQVMGTIGGNLCQGNRCRFYNQSPFWRSVRPLCFKAGGEICHVVRKPKECHSTYCGDMAPPLIALGAKIKVVGPQGERIFPLKRLYTQNGKKPLSLRKGEILKEVFLPQPSGQSIYLKWRWRGSIEFPIISLALYIENEGDRIHLVRIVLSGVGCGPVETPEIEKILTGVTLKESVLDAICNKATKTISPMRTSIYSPAYKRKMAGILLRKGLEDLKF
ncbi:MAG: FAD binding domain-containing protein [Thermodesulfobacteriota bacterium]